MPCTAALTRSKSNATNLLSMRRNGSGLFHCRGGGLMGTHAIAAALTRTDIDLAPHGFRSSFKGEQAWSRTESPLASV